MQRPKLEADESLGGPISNARLVRDSDATPVVKAEVKPEVSADHVPTHGDDSKPPVLSLDEQKMLKAMQDRNFADEGTFFHMSFGSCTNLQGT